MQKSAQSPTHQNNTTEQDVQQHNHPTNALQPPPHIEQVAGNSLSNQTIQLSQTANTIITNNDKIPNIISEKETMKLLHTLDDIVKKHPYIKLVNIQLYCNVSILLNNHKAIKYKMMNKLLVWMQKLCLQTFNFSLQTFELAIKLLVKFIVISEQQQQRAQLQMLGCVALHIASKMIERTIISIDSYAECCLNIFTRAQFEHKQAEIFHKIAYNIPDTAYYKINQLIQHHLLRVQCGQFVEHQKQTLQSGLRMIVKDVQLHQYPPIILVIGLWKHVLQNNSHQFSKQELLQNINNTE